MRVCVGRPLRNAKVVAFAVGATLSLVAIACTPASGEGPAATTPVSESPTVAAPTSGSPVPEAEVLSERMGLVGNLPGSDGSFAFWGDLAVVNVWADWPELSPDDGFIVVDISDPTRPRQLSRFRCIASFADISIWEDLVFLSQNFATAGDGCDATPTDPQDQDAFAGIRVVSIADPEHPVQVAAVPTGIQDASSSQSEIPFVWGSHTHTPVPDLDHEDAAGHPAPRILVYSADAGGELYGTEPHGSIVEVPLGDPSAAHVVATIDNSTNAPCHDMTVFMPRDLLACSAYDAGVILFDISNPVRPVQLSHFDNPLVLSHHSTTFSNDGNTLVLDAEIDTSVNTKSCAGGTGDPPGALWFYDVSSLRAPQELGFFQLPRPNAEHFCYAHESNVVPMSGPRDVVVTGWFGGGVNLVDFTDPSRPREIAFWMRSGLDGEHSFPYAGYWYNGHVYTGNTALRGMDEPVTDRGFDVFTVDHPVLSTAIRLSHMNAQTQEPLPAR